MKKQGLSNMERNRTEFYNNEIHGLELVEDQ